MYPETNMKFKQLNSKQKFITNLVFIIFIFVVWEIIAKLQLFGDNSSLVFPPLEDISNAFINNFIKGYGGISLWKYIVNSLSLLFLGLILGVLLAFILSGIAMINNYLHTVFDMLISIFDLLPGVSLLPIVIIIFGISPGVIVFLVIHSVIWPMSRNILDGFKSVPQLFIESGQNIGLRGLRLIIHVYLPASLVSILSGLKIAWSRAWRGLISAEMIFGIASCPGLGLYINQMRTNLKNAEMYATLIVIIIIGIIVQYGILSPIEKATIKKWGMSK